MKYLPFLLLINFALSSCVTLNKITPKYNNLLIHQSSKSLDLMFDYFDGNERFTIECDKETNVLTYSLNVDKGKITIIIEDENGEVIDQLLDMDSKSVSHSFQILNAQNIEVKLKGSASSGSVSCTCTES